MGVISSIINATTQGIMTPKNIDAQKQMLHEQMVYNDAQAYKQFEYNKTLAQDEFNRNIQQWQRENEYNLPANQMLRYQNAGLNPNLIYGQSNLSARSPQYSSPTYNAPLAPNSSMPYWNGAIQPFDILKDIFALKAFSANLRKSEAEATDAENKASSSKSQATIDAINAGYQDAIMEAKINNLLGMNENIGLRNGLLSFQDSLKETKRRLFESQLESTKVRGLLDALTLHNMNSYGFDPSKGNWQNWLFGAMLKNVENIAHIVGLK